MKETKVRVKVDTSQAKSQMREVKKEGERAAGGISAGLAGAVRSGFAFAGAGAAFAGGMAAVRGATQSGMGDAFGGAFTMLGQSFNDFLLGHIDDEARAIRTSREALIQTFGQTRDLAGSEGAKRFFETNMAIELEREKARSQIMGDPAFQGAGFEELAKMFGERLAAPVIEWLDSLLAALPPFLRGR